MLAPLKSRLRLLATKTQSVLMEETARLPKHCVGNPLDDLIRNFSPNLAAGEFLRPTGVSRTSKHRLHRSTSQHREKREVPRLYFVQNPLAWLTIKLNFRTLRRTWDPDFQEADFHRGTKYAISRITELLQVKDFASLEPLMTRVGLERLRQDAGTWEGVVMENIRLSPEDVQLVIPRRMTLQRVVERKFCHVDVVCVALKWMDQGLQRPAPLLYVDLVARFRRDYSQGNDSDWVVALFKLRKFNTVQA
nr:PREDICTED: uncharacterized protein LOC109043755 [Bemisia tabaci]